jgi:FMN hydrolase / 5-amino-6-(5-phospho-D-ribitylamino)uracil phosphatase
VHVLPVSGHLSGERGQVSQSVNRDGDPKWTHDLRAISFDFGNTLVSVGRQDLEIVVERTMRAIAAGSGPFDRGAFRAAWSEERERQFAEEVPRMREVDLAQRVVRILARLRGMPTPSRDVPWDDAAAAARSEPAEIERAVRAYSDAFVAALPVPAAIGPMLSRLARRYTLGILSNWPLAATIDRYVEAAGWATYLHAVVVSQRVGTIKPDPRIFRAAETALGVSGTAILHVGDDWAADVVGARRAGWRVAYLRTRPADSPLPASSRGEAMGDPDPDVAPDLELDRLGDLEKALV